VALPRAPRRSREELTSDTLKFAHEGYLPAAVPAVTGLVLAPFFGWWLFGVTLIVALLVLLFFRDPERRAPADADAIVAPADGRVLSIQAMPNGHRLAPGPMQRISIFMSPLDVHINRMPASGTILEVRFSPGQFRAAYADDASDVNESNAVLVETPGIGRMVVVQIAGWLARRIVCGAHVGDRLERAARFGLIMFGSRVDLYLPPDVSICVAEAQRVSAGATVVARAGGSHATE
jgi:phosphatidylserine decarboxylase